MHVSRTKRQCSNIPCQFQVALTHIDYDMSSDFAFLTTLVNQHVRNGHPLRQALDRALLLGRLNHTNALIRSEQGLWLVCAVKDDHLWLDFTPCCTGNQVPITYRKRKTTEFLQCKNCKKKAVILDHLKPAVLSQFLKDPVPPADIVYKPVGEWVCLALPKYGKHPLWARSGHF